MENTNNGNIILNKTAPRDKNGKRRGSFSQVDHSINAAIPQIGLDGYGIYHFLLNNAGGSFWCTVKTLAAVFGESEYCISQALAKLENTGWISKKRVGNKGVRPLYVYYVNEISTQLQAAEPPAPTTSTQTDSFAHAQQIDMSDFSADELAQVAAEPATANIAPAQKAPTPIPSPPITQEVKRNGEQYTQHILNICQSNGAFSREAKEKVIQCCRMWYSNQHGYADDNLIAKFASTFSEDSGQSVTTVYNQCCPRI